VTHRVAFIRLVHFFDASTSLFIAPRIRPRATPAVSIEDWKRSETREGEPSVDRRAR